MLQPVVLNLNEVVANVTSMLRVIIGEDIELQTALDHRLGQVKLDRGQIEQVIMNLAVNARDAMPDGGHLTIETGNVDLDATDVRQHAGVLAGPYVALTVSGMDAEVQAHLFESFFTTKEPGKGSGLGLSTGR